MAARRNLKAHQKAIQKEIKLVQDGVRGPEKLGLRTRPTKNLQTETPLQDNRNIVNVSV